MKQLRDYTTGTNDGDAQPEGHRGDGAGGRPPWGWIFSAVLILVILAAAAAIVIPRLIDDDTAGQAAHSGDATSASGGLDELFPSPPERDRLDRVMLVAGDDYPYGRALPQHTDSRDRGDSAPPGGLTLIKYLRSSVWVSATDGPDRIDEDGVPHGFAHSPQGAALAAAWMFAYGSNLDTQAAAIDEGVLLTNERIDPADRAEHKGQAAPLPAPMAFQVDWNPRLTGVDMASTSDDGWIIAHADLAWRDGDWALRADSTSKFEVASLSAGFVRWETGR